jgi:phosphoglycerate dehydrogenase-like enzyme
MQQHFRVVVTDFLDETSVEAPILGDIADLSLAGVRHESELGPDIALADALLVFHDISRLSEATFARTPQCRGVVRVGVGFNNIDLEATGSRGIVVCNVPDYGTEEVADHAMMLFLAVARQLLPCDGTIRAGGFDHRDAIATPRLRGKTLGLIGCGRIGTAMALRAKPFGLDIVFCDPYVPLGYEKAIGVRRASRLEELLEQSHFISLHCYLDERNRHMINAAALARLPEGAILINTARGPLVDQEALVEALDSGRLLGAGIDVFEREPLDNPRLRQHPRVVLTPHSAFYSIEAALELRRKAAEEVRRLLTGESPRSPVNLPFLIHPRVNLA